MSDDQSHTHLLADAYHAEKRDAALKADRDAWKALAVDLGAALTQAYDDVDAFAERTGLKARCERSEALRRLQERQG